MFVNLNLKHNFKNVEDLKNVPIVHKIINLTL